MDELMDEPKFGDTFDYGNVEVHPKNYDDYQLLSKLYVRYEYADPCERRELERDIVKASQFIKEIDYKLKIKLRLELKQYVSAYSRFSKYIR